MYQRAFSTLGCTEFDLGQAEALAKSFRLEALELRGLGNRLDLPKYLAATFGSPRELSARQANSSIRICAFGTSLRLMGSSPADREEFLEFLPWAEALQVPWLRIFDGGKDPTQIDWEAADATLTWWRRVRRERNVRADIMVETHDSFLRGKAIGELVRRCGPVKILWDTHHTWRKGGEDPQETWRHIAPSVVHVHVKDSRTTGLPNANGFEYVLPGAGEFPMRDLRRMLATSFTGVVSLEWERKWVPTLPPLAEALRSAQRHSWW